MAQPTNSESGVTQTCLDKMQAALQPAQLTPEDCLLVACSGGADSMALTVLLQLAWPAESSPQIVLAHYNHHLRDSSDRDAAFVAAYAARQSLPLLTGEAQPEQLSSRSETEARLNRYAWLQACISLLQDGSEGRVWLLTAHQRDDQAETVLMNLCRGTGLRGLGGMYPLDHERRLARPLLDIGAAELRDVLREQDETWVEDETNARGDTWRNQLRLDIMPRLNRIFDRDSTIAISRAAALLRQDEDYLQRKADEAGRAVSRRISGQPLIVAEGKRQEADDVLLYILFAADALLDLAPALSSRLIRSWSSEVSGVEWPKDVTAADEEAFRSVLLSGRGADVAGGLRLEPLQGSYMSWWRMWDSVTMTNFVGTIGESAQSLALLPANSDIPLDLTSSDSAQCREKDSSFWRYYEEGWQGKAVLRTRRPGDRIKLRTGDRIWHKKLKDWQAEQGIWPELRTRMALLAEDERITAVPQPQGLEFLIPVIIEQIRPDATD